MVVVVQDDLIDELSLTNQADHTLWPWVSGLKCLDNDKAFLNWLMLWNALWVKEKILFSKTGNFANMHALW